MEIQNEMLGNPKHNQVKLVLKVFFLLICTNIVLSKTDSISK